MCLSGNLSQTTRWMPNRPLHDSIPHGCCKRFSPHHLQPKALGRTKKTNTELWQNSKLDILDTILELVNVTWITLNNCQNPFRVNFKSLTDLRWMFKEFPCYSQEKRSFALRSGAFVKIEEREWTRLYRGGSLQQWLGQAMKGQTSKGPTFDYTLANSMPTYPTSALNGRHLAN